MDKYLASVAVKKATYMAIKAIVAYVLSDKAMKMEAQFGIHIDPLTFQAEVGTFIATAEHVVHDWLKMKFPENKYL